MSDNISFSSNRSSIQKFKIVLVGDQNVGKSSIIARYIRNEFDPTKNVPLQPLSPPSALTSSAKTYPPAEKSYAYNFGTQQGRNASKASSPVISRTLIWLLQSSISRVRPLIVRYEFS
jgi:GTPase SAR1 family protein